MSEQRKINSQYLIYLRTLTIAVAVLLKFQLETN